jgi:carboxymethylenebutenolidase
MIGDQKLPETSNPGRGSDPTRKWGAWDLVVWAGSSLAVFLLLVWLSGWRRPQTPAAAAVAEGESAQQATDGVVSRPESKKLDLPSLPPPEPSIRSFESGGVAIRIQEFLPKGKRKHPAIILLHGSSGPNWELGNAAQQLADKGYAAFVLHYLDRSGMVAVDPGVSDVEFIKWMRTVSDAILFVGKQPQVDPKYVGLLGYSLGGYLALEVAAVDSHVAAVVEYAGGMAPVIRYVVERMPPTLMLHGDADRIYPVEEIHKVERVLKRKKIAFESQIYHGEGHGFKGQAALDAWKRTLAFFDRNLKRPCSRQVI